HTPTKELAPLRNPPPLPEQKAKISQQDTSTTKPSPDETDFTEVRSMKKKHKKRQEKAGLNVDLLKAVLEPRTSRSESRASTTRPRRHTNPAWISLSNQLFDQDHRRTSGSS
ncbi:hypothetical protein ElyMa_006239900, partial [Elysia marginata]